MKYKFFQGGVTEVPVECLIDDYQTLAQDKENLNRCIQAYAKKLPEALAYDARAKESLSALQDASETISTVMDCLADSIDSHTTAPEGLKFKPSVTSVIAMGCKTGIIAREDGSDIRCAGGMDVSTVYPGCTERCPYKNKCEQELCRIQLETGAFYTGDSRETDELLDSIERYPESDTAPQHAGEAEYREYVCPSCYHTWLEDRDASDYPEYCPGCGEPLHKNEKGESTL